MASSAAGIPPPKAVHHELRTAENSAAYLLPALLELHKVKPQLRLLDVGAGSGSISATLAKAIQPEGLVTATDIKADILPRAKAVADMAGVANIGFQQADVLDRLPFENETFDVVHCHQVLAHLPRPSDALREMLRVTKLGGIVAAREGDYETEMVWPELPGFQKFHALSAGVIQKNGGSIKAGRQLLDWALQAGVGPEQVTPSLGTWCYHEAEERKTWGDLLGLFPSCGFKFDSVIDIGAAQAMVDQLRQGRLRSIGLSTKFYTEEDLDEMAEAWQNWSKTEGAILGMMHGEILVRKN